MSTIAVKDGTTIYYKDCGEGPAVTFSHGWPLNSDAWDGQMLFLAQNGFRAITHDRRGHDRSSMLSARGFHAPAAAYHRAASLGRAAQLAGQATEKHICRMNYTVESLHRDAAEILR
jgi:non-heme chloroperoxidase